MGFPKMMAHTLLSLVGSPFESGRNADGNIDLQPLYRYAAKNRMTLLYLDALERRGIEMFREDREKLSKTYSHAINLMLRVSDLLEEAGLDYAFFKSLRPYREATVDVDLLAFGSGYLDALKLMNKAGYSLLERGALSATFRDPVSKLGVDVHDEIGVSYVIYLDKEKLSEHVVRREVSGLGFVRTLSPAADLLAVISHSVMKEHMYALSEYYSTLFCLRDESSVTFVDSLRSLAERCKLESALEIHLGITASLHRDVHGFVPKCIMDAWDGLETGSWEFSRTRRLGVEFPLKYHPVTIAKALTGLLKESKGKRSMALQALKMFDPRFSPRVASRLFQHIAREMY